MTKELLKTKKWRQTIPDPCLLSINKNNLVTKPMKENNIVQFSNFIQFLLRWRELCVESARHVLKMRFLCYKICIKTEKCLWIAKSPELNKDCREPLIIGHLASRCESHIKSLKLSLLDGISNAYLLQYTLTLHSYSSTLRYYNG